MEVYPLTKDLLDKLAKEEKSSENKKLKIEKDSALEKTIENIWKEYLHGITRKGVESSDDIKFAPKSYTAKEIEFFSLNYSKFPLNKKSFLMGMYLSHLINNCTDDNITIHTNNYLFDQLGEHNNGKNITIYGDVGNFLGREQLSGKITVKGNCGSYLGKSLISGEIIVEGDALDIIGWEMRGGKITIKKNCGHYLGFHMINGIIIVNGNAGCHISLGMMRGKIYLNGYYGSISEYFNGGKIYHKSKLIAKDGKMLI